jgi:predicted phage tail component-like protein
VSKRVERRAVARVSQKRLSDFNLRALQAHVYPLVAEISHLTKKIPGIIGAYRFGQDTGIKKYVIPVRMTENDEVLAMEQMNNLNMFLLDGSYQARSLKLIFDSEPDKYINAFLSGAVNVSRNFIQNSFDLTFIAVDPRKYSNVFNDDILWGNEIITFASTYLMGHENVLAETYINGSSTFNVSVIGMGLRPAIELSGSATNLVITANGKYITVGTFANAVWVIDCERYIAYKDGVETMLDMDKFELVQGLNAVQFSGSDIDLNISIRFRDKWL